MQSAKKEQENESREYGNIRNHSGNTLGTRDQDLSLGVLDVDAVKNENSSSSTRLDLDSEESTSGSQADRKQTTPESISENEHKARGCEGDVDDKTSTGQGLETAATGASAEDGQGMPEPKADGSHVIKPWDTRPDPLSNDRMAKLEASGSARKSGSKSATARPPTPRFVRLKPLSTEITDAEAASIEQAMFKGKLAARRNAATNLEEDVARLANKLGSKASKNAAQKGKMKHSSTKKFSKFFCCTSGSDSPSPTRSPHPKCRNEVTIRVRTRKPLVTTSPTASPLLTSPVDVEIFENSIFSQDEDPTTKILAVTESNDSSAQSLTGFVNRATEEANDKVGPTKHGPLEQEDVGKDQASKISLDEVEDDGGETYVNMRSVGDGAEAENPVTPESSEEATSSSADIQVNSSDTEGSPDGAASNTDQTIAERATLRHDNESNVPNARQSVSIEESISERSVHTSAASFDFLDIKTDENSCSLVYLESHVGNSLGYEYDISKIRLAELCGRFLQEIAKTGTVGTDPKVCILTSGPVPYQTTSTSKPAIVGVSNERALESVQEEPNTREQSPRTESTSTESPASRKTTPIAEKVASYITFNVPKSSPRQGDASKKRGTAMSPMQTPLSRFPSRGRMQQQWFSQTEDNVDVVGRQRQFSTRHYPKEPFSASAYGAKPSENNFPLKPLGSQLQKMSSRSTTSLDGRQSSVKTSSIDKLKAFEAETPPVPSEKPPSRMKIPLCLTPGWEYSSSLETLNTDKAQSSEDVNKMVQHLDKLASRFCSLSSIPSSGPEARRSPDNRSSWRRSNRGSLTSQSDNKPGPSWTKYPRYSNGVVDKKACRSVAEKIISFEEASLSQPSAKRLSLDEVSRKPHELGALPPSKYFEGTHCKLKSAENARNLW